LNANKYEEDWNLSHSLLCGNFPFHLIFLLIFDVKLWPLKKKTNIFSSEKLLSTLFEIYFNLQRYWISKQLKWNKYLRLILDVVIMTRSNGGILTLELGLPQQK
jgi:hypothetical protein